MPPELVTNILKFYQDLHHPTKRDYLLTITRVCRYIRDIALGYSALWARIDISAPRRWNEECLRRSKAAMLQIYGTFPGASHTVEALLQLLREHGPRLQVIDISVFFFFAGVLDFKGSAPKLEKLVLHYMGEGTGIDLSTGMFSNRIQALHHLDLDGCRLPWTSPLLTNLTYLAIRTPTDRSHPQDILSALNTLPNLKFLSLSGTLDHTVQALELLPSTVVQLRHLTAVTIFDCDPTSIAHLISNIRFPFSAKLLFGCVATILPNPEVFLDAVAAIISRNTINNSGHHIQNLQITLEQDIATLSFVHQNEFKNAFSILLNRHPEPAYAPVASWQKLLEVVQALPLDHLEKLSLRGKAMDLEMFLEILNRAQSLNTLDIHGKMFKSLADTIWETLPRCARSVCEKAKRLGSNKDIGIEAIEGGSAKNQSRSFNFHSCTKCAAFAQSSLANLRHLVLTNGNFDSEQIDYEFYDDCFENALSHYLIFRNAIGKQLSSITLKNCKRLYDADELYDCVQKVDWDGIVIWSEDEESEESDEESDEDKDEEGGEDDHYGY
ncbi:hypothetical protein AX16_006058 [Volvariella volvacea WC 439]|nr:hypothetical protein AX16_006058 [Volvariella volvacea WC 439]